VDLVVAAEALVHRSQELDHAAIDRRHLSRVVAAQE
jgi:hypothetical protein